MVNVKLWLILSGGGSKKDFVAGWLGTLPDFVSSHWHIDPMTGQSVGFMRNTQSIDQQATSIETLLNDQQLTLDATAPIIYAGTCHGMNLHKFTEEILQNQICVYKIDDSSADNSEIAWDFAVKTFATKKNTSHNLSLGRSGWPIDRELTSINDQERVNEFKKILAVTGNGAFYQKISYDFPVTKLDYTNLFRLGGSRYLCEVIGITVDQRYHDHWDYMLPLSTSPHEFKLWGHVWRKSDYF